MNKDDALRLALEALEESLGYIQEEAENAQRLYGQYPTRQARIQGLKDDARKHMDAITAIREVLAEQPHCDDCGGFDPECPLAQLAQQEIVPVTDNTYGYAKNLAETIFKQHFASDEHYASGRIVWGVNDTVIGILTQIDNMVADMVRRPAQQPEYKHCDDGKVILKNPEVLSQLLREQQQEEPKRWAVFCSQCRKEWSVSYPHPGKSICAECDAKVGAQQQEPDK